jgi:GH15 family glucan-1,4-alpha-glucosidase
LADVTYPPIEDYALIGDCGSAALVSKSGAIEWLCWPRFDSPSVFGAILDCEQGGFFHAGPAADDYRVERRYLDRTNVLETTFYTEHGTLRLTDAMPVAEAQAYRDDLWPVHEVLRRVECVEGAVEVEITCDPRPGYGRREPSLQERGALGFFYQHGPSVLVVRSEVDLARADDGGVLAGRVPLEEGDRRFLSLTYDEGEPAVLPLLDERAEERLAQTARYWRTWADRCTYDAPARAAGHAGAQLRPRHAGHHAGRARRLRHAPQLLRAFVSDQLSAWPRVPTVRGHAPGGVSRVHPARVT